MASILVIRGDLEGQFFLLPDEPIISIGRDDQCTIQLVDPSISRKHLQIRMSDDGADRVAADYRSANGVIVNGHRILDPVPIKDGDEIALGETTLVYLDADHPDAKSAMIAVRRKGEWRQSTIVRNESRTSS